MKLKIIGSGNGVPEKNHYPPCFALEYRGEPVLLVDTGYDSLANIRTLTNAERIGRVFITHTHPDHFFGLLPLIFYFKCLSRRQTPLVVHGHRKTGSFLRLMRTFYGGWMERTPAVDFTPLIPSQPLQCGRWTVRSMRTGHSADALALSFTRSNRTIVFTGDAVFSPALVNFAKNAYIVVSECSFPKDGDNHLDAAAFLRLAVESGAERIVMVHRYARPGMTAAVRRLRRILGDRLIVGTDGLEVNT